MLGMFLFGTWYGGVMSGVIVAQDCQKEGKATFASWLYTAPIVLTCKLKGTP